MGSGAPALVAVLARAAKFKGGGKGKPQQDNSRDDFNAAVRDFRNAETDDEAAEALLAVIDLAQGVSRDAD